MGYPTCHLVSYFFIFSSLQKEKLTKSYVHQPSSLKFLGRTIGQALEDIAIKHPNKEAFVFCSEGIRKTYEEVLHDVRKAAAGFLSIGINRGDRLGIWGPNSYDWVVTQLAAAQIGAILVNINPGYRSAELNYCLNKAGVKAIVSYPAFKTSDYYAMLKENCPELDDCQPGQLKSTQIPSLETVIMMGDDTFKGTYKFKEVTENGKEENFQTMKKLHESLGFDDAINIQFTSGTTGFPKGCTLSHQTLLNNAHSIGYVLNYNQEGSRICLPIPLYHAFAATGGPMTTITHPVPSIFPSPQFEPEPTLEAIDKEKVTSIYATPTIFVLLLSDPNFNKYNYDTLQSGLMGGSPCPAALMKQVIEKMGVPYLMIGYGLTETGPAMTITPKDVPAEERITFVGNTIHHQELKVVDPVTRTILPVNTQGEVCCRGYNVMLGYWQDEEKTKEVIDDANWFSTGDLGTIDEDGKLRITGRIKDTIIRGGENIFPAEIENFLLGHPKVENAQVVGIPNETWGEEVCACIKLRAGQTATRDEIIEFCKGKIAHFKVPAHVVFMDTFPLTVTFKVKKFELRDIAAKKLSEEEN
ncbi:Acyl-CoA synthetase family member 2, mitochondrial [Holothuria leucospilota]|uniref:Medium-chain acyl-CoA ligase ACSF2, mitochondrial n=1 Tax=Holothuria leucospilota TaxID=206669 RepID=A0A9Q1BJH1_HOLLE|nr:Acyl-CoA synthetase family member 2, mitochondrial [Holothuria leucospilota]